MKYLNKTSMCIVFALLCSLPAQAEENFWSSIKSDYAEFYSADRFMRMGVIFAGGAVLAHSDADQNLQNDYQNNIHSNYSDDFSAAVKSFGEGKYLIPLSLLAAGVDSYFNEAGQRTGQGKWGEITARSYFVGAPALLATQRITGASRPSESPFQSDWEPFNDSNGVSGHAFIGAVPFITIAYMNDDNAFVKSAAYIASAFTAISRINDNQHYLSQAILGWYLGWESVDAVHSVESGKKKINIRPLAGYDLYGLQLVIKWN
ncbi:MAG: phosphatase PAP2 family protein [Gammaproteobacteria bacterium]|nr:phosphatase PAP2 family protein [Gammaproteobacteria bacterium]